MSTNLTATPPVENNTAAEVCSDCDGPLGDNAGCDGLCGVCADPDEVCSQCDGSLDDNEGYDGLCGTCADRAEAEDRWS